MGEEDKIDYGTVTNAAMVDITNVLSRGDDNHPNLDQRVMPMEGFDNTFVDIVDYILRITYWIWHDHKVDLCSRYYSDDCVLHTMAGDLQGCQTVIDNTYSTLKAFPDRTLDGENVIWSSSSSQKGEIPSFYSSHLIVSHMTNQGDSEWGPAPNIRARIRTIADCVCTENKIVEEWLMRDNVLLVKTLGFDVHKIALQQAESDLKEGKNLLEFLKDERQRIRDNTIVKTQNNFEIEQTLKGLGTILIWSDIPEKNPEIFATTLFASLWQQPSAPDRETISIFYDYRVSAHLTAGRELYGTVELGEYLSEFQQGLANICVSVDHVASIPYMGNCEGAVDVAIRWTMTAVHDGDSYILGLASGTPIYILASSHWRIQRHRIREEWTVFDELALHRQVATQRLLKNTTNN